MLVIVRNEAALDGVAHSLPPLVILVENVASLYAGVLVDHKQRTGIERQPFAACLIPIQQPSYRVAQPARCLIPAVRQERMEHNVKPAVAELLHAARNLYGGQDRLVHKASHARRIPLTELPQLQRGALEIIHGLLQCFLQLIGVHLPAVGQRHQ